MKSRKNATGIRRRKRAATPQTEEFEDDPKFPTDARGWVIYPAYPDDVFGVCECGHHYFDHGEPFNPLRKLRVHMDTMTPIPPGHTTTVLHSGKGNPCLCLWRYGEKCGCKGFRRAKKPKRKPVPPPPPPVKPTREVFD